MSAEHESRESQPADRSREVMGGISAHVAAERRGGRTRGTRHAALGARIPQRPILILAGLVAAVLLLGAAAASGRALVGGSDLLLPAGLLLMVALAYANGANDVSKTIATLVGSGVAEYRRAVAWGTICTVAGGLCSALIASALIGTFTKGFIAASVRQTETFTLAVLVGAILWVLLANRIAMPVSTTHAVTGALVSVGAVAFGAGNVQWSTLVQKVAIPLALSPFLALALALLVYLLIRLGFARVRPNALSALHWLSSGTAAFARGLNDAPKIVALGVAFYLITDRSAEYQAPLWLFAAVALAMGAGSLVGGSAVTRTLAEKVTRMDHTEGLAANLTTAALVAAASNLGLPVSTTHVSSGAIIGIGLREGVGRVRWSVVRDIALAWIVTLPAAGLLGVLAYLVLTLVRGAL